MAETNDGKHRQATDFESHASGGSASPEIPKHPRVEPPNSGPATSRYPMGRFADFIAGINASVRVKLLGGFFLVVLLLLAMSFLSFIVIGQMNQKVETLTELQERVDRGRQMIYLVTAQSHFRAMA